MLPYSSIKSIRSLGSLWIYPLFEIVQSCFWIIKLKIVSEAGVAILWNVLVLHYCTALWADRCSFNANKHLLSSQMLYYRPIDDDRWCMFNDNSTGNVDNISCKYDEPITCELFTGWAAIAAGIFRRSCAVVSSAISWSFALAARLVARSVRMIHYSNVYGFPYFLKIHWFHQFLSIVHVNLTVIVQTNIWPSIKTIILLIKRL